MSTEPPNDTLDPPAAYTMNKRSANATNGVGIDARATGESRLSTPFSSRPNSTTNLASLSTKIHMRRPKMDECTGSMESVTKTPQKTSNPFTIHTSARGANGTPINTPSAATSVKHTPTGSVSGANATGSLSTPALTSHDMGKKRLVDQFYSSYKDPHTSSGVDLSLSLRNGASVLPSAEKTFSFTNYKATSASEDSLASIGDLVHAGAFAYVPMQNHLRLDDAMTDQLLNIDSLVSHDQPTTDATPSGLAAVARSLSDTVVAHTKDRLATSTPNHSHAPPASTDLDRLEAYLSDVRKSTVAVLDHLESNKEVLKDKFRTDINVAMHKLDEIVATVNSLEFRLNYTRSNVNRNKLIMSQGLSPKLALLDRIDRRMAEAAKASTKRHLRHLSAVVALLLALGLVYTVYSR